MIRQCIWCDKEIEYGFYCAECQKLFDDMAKELRE